MRRLTPSRNAGTSQSLLTSAATEVRGEGHIKYAGFVWPGRALIEMKSRGVKPPKYYQQTANY